MLRELNSQTTKKTKKNTSEDLGSSGNIRSDIFKWLTKKQVNVFLPNNAPGITGKTAEEKAKLARLMNAKTVKISEKSVKSFYIKVYFSPGSIKVRFELPNHYAKCLELSYHLHSTNVLGGPGTSVKLGGKEIKTEMPLYISKFIKSWNSLNVMPMAEGHEKAMVSSTRTPLLKLDLLNKTNNTVKNKSKLMWKKTYLLIIIILIK